MTAPGNIWSLSAETYQRHPLHQGERDWPESNCYIDIWIEVLHALALDVPACLAFTVATDFEGDQWTFFKPPLPDLEELYGIRVEELTLWRSLFEQCQTQIARESLPIVEVDAFYLPDTRGTDYQTNHVKTSIAMAQLSQEKLGYFHNASYFELEGADLKGIFGIEPTPGAAALPPYAEIAKLGAVQRHAADELRALSFKLAQKHFERRPKHNPFLAYIEALPTHLDWLLTEGEATYHAYSFASLRQAGAAFELAGKYAEWLAAGTQAGDAARDGFLALSAGAKTLMLKAARIAHSKRAKDLRPNVETLAHTWSSAMGQFERVVTANSPPPKRTV